MNATFTTTKSHQIGDEVAGVPISVSADGLTSEMARVRITGVVGSKVIPIPDWMRGSPHAAELTETTYACEVLHSRESGVPIQFQ